MAVKIFRKSDTLASAITRLGLPIDPTKAVWAEAKRSGTPMNGPTSKGWDAGDWFICVDLDGEIATNGEAVAAYYAADGTRTEKTSSLFGWFKYYTD